MLEVGSPAPDFTLEDQSGSSYTLSDQRGKWVVVYFYPKDDTPGCAKEACSFRDALPRFQDVGAEVYGVSADDRGSHEKFARKYDLNFPLLVDPEKRVLNAYGAYGEKSMYGKKYMGVLRVTYLIDPDGRVAKVWPKVKPEGHADEVRAAIAELS
jgi:thioredoxin-dependent peroxiredoxin